MRTPMRLALPLLAMVAVSVPAWAGAPDASLGEQPPAATPETKPTDDGADPAVKRVTKDYNLEKGKPAIQGYDPVAYFPEGGGAAKKGSKDYAFTYRGVTYWFGSQANLDAFKKDPRRYEPAYGGWCAYAMGAKSEKVEIDPTSFKITDGRLYLFYKSLFNDTRATWVKEEKTLQPAADKNWKKVSGEDPPRPSGQ